MAAEIPKHWYREETMGPREVGKLFNVDTRTIGKWAANGMIGFFRTPSGKRRFPESEVRRLMATEPPEDPQLLIDLAKQDHEKYHAMWKSGWHNGNTVGQRKTADDE